jgi:hypothetical protein
VSGLPRASGMHAVLRSSGRPSPATLGSFHD